MTLFSIAFASADAGHFKLACWCIHLAIKRDIRGERYFDESGLFSESKK